MQGEGTNQCREKELMGLNKSLWEFFFGGGGGEGRVGWGGVELWLIHRLLHTL